MNEKALSAFPDWARELVEEKTPYLASDPDLTVIAVGESRVRFRSRGFIYTVDRGRQQVI